MARTKKTAEAAEPTREVILAYKGFNEHLACTPNGSTFQYEVGKTYRHDGVVKACGAGFHACEHPLDVLRYYPPAHNRFAVVELAGEMAREKDGDSKIAAAEITIKAEIRLPELIEAAVKYVLDRVKWIDGTYAQGEHEAVKTSKTGGAATASGQAGKVRGAEGCALFLVERDDSGEIVHVWAGIAGRDGIEPMAWYHLQDGKPVLADIEDGADDD